jgi:hypothetical protein
VQLVENFVVVASPLSRCVDLFPFLCPLAKASLLMSSDHELSIINLFPFLDNIIPSFIPVSWRRDAVEWVKHDREGWYGLMNEAIAGKGSLMSTCVYFQLP